jgi:hypothetical protein
MHPDRPYPLFPVNGFWGRTCGGKITGFIVGAITEGLDHLQFTNCTIAYQF